MPQSDIITPVQIDRLLAHAQFTGLPSKYVATKRVATEGRRGHRGNSLKGLPKGRTAPHSILPALGLLPYDGELPVQRFPIKPIKKLLHKHHPHPVPIIPKATLPEIAYPAALATAAPVALGVLLIVKRRKSRRADELSANTLT